LELVEQVLVAVDLMLALGAAPEQHLVAAAVVEVVAADSHQTAMPSSTDLDVDHADLA
jgi:hypothetical protein